METFVKQIVNGITIGSLYALVAMGYNLIFGVLSVLSFAQGAIIMIGAYAMIFAISVLSLSYPLAIAFGVLTAGATGLMVERVSVRPIKVRRGKDMQWGVIIATIGMVIFLEALVRRFTSGRPESFPVPFETVYFQLPLDVRITSLQLILMTASLALLAVLMLLIYRTKYGQAVRAIAQSQRFAHCVGIDTQRITVLTFGLASAIGGATGILYSIHYKAVYVYMGSTVLGLKGLVVIIVAGVGNLPGCVAMGLVLGILEVMSVGYISSSYRDFIAYGILLIMLFVRPSGLFGERGKVEYTV